MSYRLLTLLLSVPILTAASTSVLGSEHRTTRLNNKASQIRSRRMNYVLEKAHSFSCLAKTEVGSQGTNGQSVLVDGPIFYVRAMRPGSLRIEDKSRILQPKHRGAYFAVSLTDLVVTDGKALLQGTSRFKEFRKVKGTPYIADAKAENVENVGGNRLFIHDFTRAFPFKYDRETREDGIPVKRYLYDFTDARKNHRRILLDLNSKTGLPIRYSEYYRDSHGKVWELNRVMYSDWRLNVKFRKSIFDPTLPKGSKLLGDEKTEPLYDERWKAGMTPAPTKTTDMNGKEVTLDDFAGKVVLVDYWATWCGPCMAELPRINKLYKALHGQGLEIISISLDMPSAKEQMTKVIESNEMKWTHICDGQQFNSPLAQAYKIGGIPFCIVVGRDGKIAAIDVHGDQLEKAIRDALTK